MQKNYIVQEVIIALLLLGLLIVGIFYSQEFIENAKVKNTVNIITKVRSAVNDYQKTYGAIPGDDCCIKNKSKRSLKWSSALMGTGQDSISNGIIDDATSQTWSKWQGWQHVTFWIDLYASGLVSGDTQLRDASLFPRTAWGIADIIGAGQVYGFANNSLILCLDSVPGSAARQIDTDIDDGAAATGAVRSSIGSSPTAAIPVMTGYSEDLTYTVCVAL